MHPFNDKRAHKVQKDRVGKMTAGYAKGGMAHSDAAQDKAMIKKMVKGTALRADGGAVRPRADRPARAKGGRVKGTNINIIVAPKSGDAPAMAAPPMPPKPPMAPPAPPVPAMGPQAGLGGMPPMPPGPPRSEGGRAYKKGGAVTIAKGYTPVQHSGNKSDAQNIGRGPAITKATGGAIYADGRKGKQMAWLKGVGAGGGKGRLKKAHHRNKA